MTPSRWHRYALLSPFALILLVMLIGGAVNRVDAHGRIIDDTTSLPIAVVAGVFGSLSSATATHDTFIVGNLPRGSFRLTTRKIYALNYDSAACTATGLEP